MIGGAIDSILRAKTEGLGHRARDGVSRVTTLAKVGWNTGLLESLKPDAALFVLREVAQGRQTPSTIFRFHAKNSPDRLALVDKDRRLTFGDLEAAIQRLAEGLSAHGLKKGSSCVLMLKNRAEFLFAQGALARIGAAAVSVSYRSTADELVYLVEHCGAGVLLVDGDCADVAAAALPKLTKIKARDVFTVGRSDDRFASYGELEQKRASGFEEASEASAVVIYTSGTTGKPKGAVRKFPRDAIAQALRFIAETRMKHDDVHLALCPLYHSTAFGFATLTYLLGGAVVLEEFHPEMFCAAIERHHATTMAVVPTMLHRVLALGLDARKGHDLSTLHTIFTGGAQLPAPLGTAVMDAFGDVLFNFYGATETGLVTLAKPSDLRRSPGTIGKPVPGNEIRLLDDAGNVVPKGEVGELFTKNPMLVEGYHKDENATSASMKDGFFTVGDLAREDAFGCFQIEGRKRDMIISGGVNVYPVEIEDVLVTLDGVAEAAVVGVPDQEWGERVCAFIVAKPGASASADDLRVACRAKLSGPKVPREFVFLEKLPRNPTGKVLKRELRALRT